MSSPFHAHDHLPENADRTTDDRLRELENQLSRLVPVPLETEWHDVEAGLERPCGEPSTFVERSASSPSLLAVIAASWLFGLAVGAGVTWSFTSGASVPPRVQVRSGEPTNESRNHATANTNEKSIELAPATSSPGETNHLLHEQRGTHVPFWHALGKLDTSHRLTASGYWRESPDLPFAQNPSHEHAHEQTSDHAAKPEDSPTTWITLTQKWLDAASQ